MRIFEKKSTIFWISAFITNLTVFGVLYWIIHLTSPDAFIISSQFNEQPISKFSSQFYETDDPSSLIVSNEEELRREYVGKAIQLDVVYKSLTEAQEEYSKLELEQRGALSSLEFSREHENVLHENSLILPLEKDVAKLDAEIEALKSGSDQRILLLSEKLFLLEQITQQRETLTRKYSQLGSDHIKQEINSNRENLDTALQKVIELNGQFRDKRSELAATYRVLREETVKVVSLVDFIYFSACISTTTTFGDITPNNIWVRFAVIMQIVTGIIIIAFFLDEATKRKF